MTPRELLSRNLPCGIWTRSLSRDILPFPKDSQIWHPSRSRMMTFQARTIFHCVQVPTPVEISMTSIPGLWVMQMPLTVVPFRLQSQNPQNFKRFPFLFLISFGHLPLAQVMWCINQDPTSQFRTSMTRMAWASPRSKILTITLPFWTFLHMKMTQVYTMAPSLAPMILVPLDTALTLMTAMWLLRTTHGIP